MAVDRFKLEALAEAIIHYSGYRDPGSPLYAARNPGGLKAFSPNHLRDEHGNRVFASVMDGLQALFFDTALKLSGESRAHLRPDNNLTDFAAACGKQPTEAVVWSSFLRKAFKDERINQKTPIQFFLE